MKRIFTIIASALLVFSLASSCDKEDDKATAPYYKLSKSMRIVSGTSGTSDFSQISAVSDQYINSEFATEQQALDVYKDVISKTKDASYSAPDDAFFALSIVRYVCKQEGENMYRYDVDPNYKSPVGHIWDAQGSRDL